MSKRKHFQPLQVLKPGTYDLKTPGHGVPGKEFPKRCLHCHKLIGEGDIWWAHFNGEYTIIFHSACEIESKQQASSKV